MSRTSRIRLFRGGDTTCPILSAPTGAKASDTTADGTVVVATTTAYKEGGTLYSLFSTSAFATSAAVLAGDSQAVTIDGTQTLTTKTGLSASTTYYIHYVYTDFVETTSNVVVSPSFTTDPAAGGVTLRTLSLLGCGI